MLPLRDVKLEPEISPDYVGPEIRKIIYGRHPLGALKILKSDGSTQVNAYNFANYLYPYGFTTSEETRLEHPLGISRTLTRSNHYRIYIEALFGMGATLPRGRNYTFWRHRSYTPPYLVYWSHADEENSDVEQPDKFFWIPPVETAAHRSARFQDELTHVARMGVEKLLLINDTPEILAGYSSYGNSSSAYDNFLRNAMTSFKACIGYLQSHLTADTLTQTIEDAIFGLYEYFHTVDTRDASGAGIDFYKMCFDTGTASGWHDAYSSRLVRMPNTDGTVGDILRDVNYENSTAGVVDVVAASNEHRGYAITHFDTAYFHTDQNHGQVEELRIEEYTPAERNTNLSGLRLWISSAAAGAELTFTEAFDADTLTYTGSTTWGARETVFIEATTENPNATIAGNGLVNTVVGINELEVVVTSQDGHATKTYTINTTRT